MKPQSCAALVPVVLLSLAVGACGGGGSKDRVEVQPPPVSPETSGQWPLDAKAVRRVTGGDATGFSGSEVGPPWTV